MRVALRGRSGNRPPRGEDGDSDSDGDGDGAAPGMALPGCGWARTRAALVRLEAALRCSRCGSVLQEPVSLGRCEHVFCLSCVGDCVGRECPVCHTPAWVQDAQINRQLDNMIQLCSKLRHLLGEDASDSAEVTSTQPDPKCEAKSKKEQIKMWFSPRSRKIRCTLNKREPVTKSNNVCEDPSSVYHFFPSPPHEKPPKQAKKPTHKMSKKMKKKHLADINKMWGFQKLEQKEAEQISNRERCVTICSQPVTLCTPEPNTPEETLQQESVKDSSKNVENTGISPQVRSSEKKDIHADVCPAQGSKEEVCVPEKPLSVEIEATPLKRGREQVRFPVTSQSKRPRRSERILTRSSGSQESCLEELPQGSPVSLLSESQSPVHVCSSVSKQPIDTIMKTRSAALSQEINSPSLSKVPSTPSTSKTCSQIGVPPSPSVLKSPGNNMIARRNYKGETLLHVASIKGDLAAVEQLLKNGADPNVKDNAGWTPLHEACNHGHKEVVELLLQHRALVNTTGYQNDSPLHDAAKNGHVSVVELLLLHGASRDAVIAETTALQLLDKTLELGDLMLQSPNTNTGLLSIEKEAFQSLKESNIFGLRPVDYAESEKMKSVLQLPMGKASLPLNQPSEPMSPSQPREGPLGILGSNLSSEQQKLLSRLVTTLKARRCTEFNSTVTHLVIPDAPMPSTFKCMMAVLTGCWVLKFEWVQVCLQTKVREQEEKYEIQGGPQRGRLNREQLLPKLFDGCYFYFLGSFTRPQKSDLSELAKAAGGQILVRQPKPESDVTQTINTVAYHAEPSSDQRFCTQYVIYDAASKFKPEKIRQGKVWMAPSSWLIDCVVSFQLLPVK